MFNEPRFTETRPALTQATRNATTEGPVIDSKGFGCVEYDITVGVAGETLSLEKSIVFLVLESDIGADGTFEYWQSVDTGLPMVYPFGLHSLSKSYEAPHPAVTTESLRYTGAKRFTRLHVRFVGTHATGTPTSATAKLGNPLKSARAV